ncbi:MAG TPA: RNA polymerase sigma factor [Vicinamibacterales bacterium]|nr:RNA polymerase sigma factor [Vicinamibacterales bacterium]
MSADEQLLASFLDDRSDAAFRALYERHAPAMYALAFRLMGGREADAADALQDAWARAWLRLESFRAESSLRTWLCGFVVNCCRERFRGPMFEALPDEAAPSSSRELRLDLERALASLSAGHRAVLVLHDIEGYTHREIAAVLDIDEGTSKSQLSRGRAALRKRLTDSEVPHGRP